MLKNNLKDNEKLLDNLYEEISSIINNNKEKIVYQINNTLINTYFNIGKIIVKNEQNGNIRADYGKEVLLRLSKKLTTKFGSGFSRSNLQNMRLFFIRYENCQTMSGNLSWSHYCYLIYIEDEQERSFYEKECLNSKWSVRELKRQIDSSLFQRLLLSKGYKNKEKVYELSRKGQVITTPTDILKEPYVFEFLGIKEEKPILESDLEKSLINHLSAFLMELGKGFMYVGNQMRITLDNNTHYYIDLVFYNKILHSYVLIDLKMDEMKPEYVGQMNMYVNYYNNEIRDDFDNETIGIILCKGKKEITMEYALGGLSNNVFASTYTYYIPDKEMLINEIEKILENK
ncbi:MAG: PDDEXK nuclease domain-containing protein [Ruminococcus sp.]|nr:PDDEXK nuclease domain-containing protein [Ruminococcus sp.]